MWTSTQAHLSFDIILVNAGYTLLVQASEILTLLFISILIGSFTGSPGSPEVLAFDLFVIFFSAMLVDLASRSTFINKKKGFKGTDCS